MPTTFPSLNAAQVRQLITSSLQPDEYRGQRVLLIVPDKTWTAPLPLLFDAVYQTLRSVTKQLDVLVSLETHPPLSDSAICELLGISQEERGRLFLPMEFFNHDWDNPAHLVQVGKLTAEEVGSLTDGLLHEEIPVQVNSLVQNYDLLLVIGPVFPHEIVGFSGGNKYLVPGIAGPDVIHAYHWLGALISNKESYGQKDNPVRKLVDRAAELIPVPCRHLACVVSRDGPLNGVFYGSADEAWRAAADLSSQVHIEWKTRPYQLVVACAPPMYDELWVAGRCLSLLDPIVGDGGELVLYAPHIERISVTHGQLIEEVGYHCRDYFTAQWPKFQHVPRRVLAHSTHIRGSGKYENGVEQGRIQVTLATKLPQELCAHLNLGYRDPGTLSIEQLADREDEGILLVPKAGETLYRLREPNRPVD